MRDVSFNKKLLATLLGLWQAAFLLAQDGHIKGNLTNGNENLFAATVVLGDKTVLTNLNGEFLFSVRPGVYSLIITHAGYKKIEESILVEAGITQILNYVLSPVEQLGEVVVLGSRSMIQRSNLNTPV